MGVRFRSVWSSGFSLAQTSFFFKEGLVLYAIIGGVGKIWFRSVLFLINFQEYCVAYMSLSGCLLLTFLFRASFLSLNGMSLMLSTAAAEGRTSATSSLEWLETEWLEAEWLEKSGWRQSGWREYS